MSNYVVTIARGLGSGGSHVANQLGEELGIKVYDTKILEMASELSGINIGFFYQANEKIDKKIVKTRNSKGVYTGIIYKLSDSKYLSNENLFNYQAEVIKSIALSGKESCIIIGKAANVIIGQLKNVVTVNIQAPMSYCIENVSRRTSTNTLDAKETIIRTDRYRSDYYKYYTGGKWEDSREYDLTINTAAVGEKFAVQEIKNLLKMRGLI